MFSTVLFSVTLCPTAAQALPFSLRTSFWGSMNTTAVSVGVRPLPDRCPGLTLVLDDWASDCAGPATIARPEARPQPLVCRKRRRHCSCELSLAICHLPWQCGCEQLSAN